MVEQQVDKLGVEEVEVEAVTMGVLILAVICSLQAQVVRSMSAWPPFLVSRTRMLWAPEHRNLHARGQAVSTVRRFWDCSSTK